MKSETRFWKGPSWRKREISPFHAAKNNAQNDLCDLDLQRFREQKMSLPKEKMESDVFLLHMDQVQVAVRCPVFSVLWMDAFM